MNISTAPTHSANMTLMIPIGKHFDATRHFDALVSVTKHLDERSDDYRKQLSDVMHVEAGKLPEYSQCCEAHNLANKVLHDTGPAFHLTSQIESDSEGSRHLVLNVTPIEPAYLKGNDPAAPAKETWWLRTFMNRVVERLSDLSGKLFGRDPAPIDREPSVGYTNAMITFLPGAMEQWVVGHGLDAGRVVALVRSKDQQFLQIDNLAGAARKSEQVAGIEPIDVAAMVAARNARRTAATSHAPAVRKRQS